MNPERITTLADVVKELHDKIRNPLTVINLTAERLQEGGSKKDLVNGLRLIRGHVARIRDDLKLILGD